MCVGGEGGEEGIYRWTRCSSLTKAPSAVTTSTTGTTDQCGSLCWWCVCGGSGCGGGVEGGRDGQVDTVEQLDISGHNFYNRDNGSVS